LLEGLLLITGFIAFFPRLILGFFFLFFFVVPIFLFGFC
jgi:hypothetical protein